MAFGEHKTFPNLLNTGQIGERIGLKLPAGFITDDLGMEPAIKDKAARYWKPEDVKTAFDKLEKRIMTARIKLAAQISEGYFNEGGGAFTAAANKPKASTAPKPAADDLDDL